MIQDHYSGISTLIAGIKIICQVVKNECCVYLPFMVFVPDHKRIDIICFILQKGAIYGWASFEGYALNRPFIDGQYAGLEFNTDSTHIAADTYTSTYAVNFG